MIRQDAQVLGWIWGTVRPDLVAIVGIPLALVVTAHVLLRKRDVAAAIGWIGLAWLSPVLGACLYALFGVSRVSRRARLAREGIETSGDKPKEAGPELPSHLAPLEAAVREITGNPLAEGNDVAMLHSGEHAYPAMLEAIAAATETIGLSTYILRVDGIGRSFVAALAAAQARGVSVRVLVDGIGSGYFLPGAYGRLRRLGVPVGRFMHSSWPWRMPFLNLRSHKKLLVVDGRVSFVGGLNIADENVVATGRGVLVRDTHFRIDGPVSAQLSADFVRDWLFVTGEDLSGPAWSPEPGQIGRTAARAVPSGPDEDVEKVEFAMLQAFACARRSIRLMTPYFLPDELFVTSLAMAAMRGVGVDIVIPARSNHRYVDWATRAHVGPLLDNDVRVWLNPPPFDHSKLLVIDEEWCFLGSANADMRSLRLNFELNVETYGEVLAHEVDDFIRSRQLTRLTAAALDGRRLPTRLRDAAARLALPYL